MILINAMSHYIIPRSRQRKVYEACMKSKTNFLIKINTWRTFFSVHNNKCSRSMSVSTLGSRLKSSSLNFISMYSFYQHVVYIAIIFQLSVSRRTIMTDLRWWCLSIRKILFHVSRRMRCAAGGAFLECLWCLWVQIKSHSANQFNRDIFQIFNVSLIPTFGMMFEPFFEGNNESADTVLNLFHFLTILTIMVTGFLVKDLSARNFVIIGSSMTFLGLVCCSVATSSMQMIFSFSIMVGIGLGLLNPAAFVAVLSCFTCKRTFAISIGFAALGFGQMIMPMIVKHALAAYGYRTTLYIASALAAIGLIGGNFLVPIKWKPCVQNDSESQPLLIRKPLGGSSILTEIIQATDLDLLWSFRYITIIFGLCIVYGSSTNFNITFPVYLQVSSFQTRKLLSTKFFYS